MTLLADPQPQALRIPTKKGAPKRRIRGAWQAYQIGRELHRANRGRAKKRSRVFKAYNRHPPAEYSTLFTREQDWMSNVNFGMMAYVVDNNLSSFFDMVTERTMAADIRTKHGKTPKERVYYSDHISIAFDRLLREWDDFLLNIEQDLLDMLLYGKGIEWWDDDEGFFSEHVSADDFLVPDGTKISLRNFTECVVKRRYSISELWDKIEDEKAAEARGWNREGVLKAMKMNRKAWRDRYKTDDGHEHLAKDISEGNVSVSSHLKEHIDTFVVFIKEFDGKISKYIVLQDYSNFLVNEKRPQGADKEGVERDTINKADFLYAAEDHADCINDIFSVFMDCAGSGMWHNVPSLAEKIFVQCRQYDFTMNAIMDAIKLNMTLMLQASTTEASDKLKELVWGPYTIIPSDIPFVQQRMQLDTQNATNAVQFMMLDMFRGIGEYRVHEKSGTGQNPTATQSQLDAAEAAKLTGTQLKRYNGQHSLYYRKLYPRIVSLKEGEKGYELFQKFKDYLKENGVPDEAWKWENIDSINSNMLAGAGSPSYKLMAAEKTIQLTNVSPISEGQANAVEDALAALHGRSNVGRYVEKMRPDPTFNEQKAGWENSMLANPFLNPQDVKVTPEDNDVHHLDVHFFDMERTVSLVNESMKNGSLTEYMGQTAAFKLLNQGGHCLAHVEKLKKDEGKMDMVKVAVQKLNKLQRAADKMAKDMKAMKEAKQSGGLDPNDPDIMKQVAMSQIQISTAEKLAEIKVAGRSMDHQQKLQIGKEKAANEIAINRAKELDKLEQAKKTKAVKPKAKPPTA